MKSERTIKQVSLLGLALASLCFLFVDTSAYHLLQPGSDLWARIWSLLSRFGLSGWMLISSAALTVTGALLYRLGQQRGKALQRGAGFVFSAIVVTGLITQAFKHLIGRARPEMFEQLGPYHFNPLEFSYLYASMPSGHTTSIFALATSVSILLPPLRIPLLLFAGISGLSRTYVGAHYLSDVIAGATLGIVGTILLARRMLK